MTKTIKCTNPICESLIPVEAGAMQIICPNCNTWHFPSNESEADAYPSPASTDGYSLPPVSEELNSDSIAQMPPPPPVDATPSYVEQQEPATTQDFSDPDRQAKQLGSLIAKTGERLVLREGRNVIGRKNADLIIDDRTVSRKHCIIEITVGSAANWEYTIYDIGHLEGTSSTNGVFVSGRTLRLQDYERIPIGNGTAIRIGNVSLTLQC